MNKLLSTLLLSMVLGTSFGTLRTHDLSLGHKVNIDKIVHDLEKCSLDCTVRLNVYGDGYLMSSHDYNRVVEALDKRVNRTVFYTVGHVKGKLVDLALKADYLVALPGELKNVPDNMSIQESVYFITEDNTEAMKYLSDSEKSVLSSNKYLVLFGYDLEERHEED